MRAVGWAPLPLNAFAHEIFIDLLRVPGFYSFFNLPRRTSEVGAIVAVDQLYARELIVQLDERIDQRAGGHVLKWK